MREARDWVEYCNGTEPTALVKLRQQHGYQAPHQVKYWGIGNEVDGPWQIGYKTAEEYARLVTEFGKVMKWVDPDIKLIAHGVSNWAAADFVERGQLLLEQASHLIDYMALHWYVDNPDNDFQAYMALSELFEARLSAYEGLLQALRLERDIKRPIYLAVDEWNVWHRKQMDSDGHNGVVYNLEDALVVAMHFNAFIRHANMVRMANIAQIVNVLAPIFTCPDGLVLQTIFYPFELFSSLCGTTAVDVHWGGDTFSAGNQTGLRTLDVVATLAPTKNELVLFVINRSEDKAVETQIVLSNGQFAENIRSHVINGSGIKAENTFEHADQVNVNKAESPASSNSATFVFEPHSVTALVCPIS
jgi:alpha-N-arabinofuranosidase